VADERVPLGSLFLSVTLCEITFSQGGSKRLRQMSISFATVSESRDRVSTAETMRFGFIQMGTDCTTSWSLKDLRR
jgi:hypothetical protein